MHELVEVWRLVRQYVYIWVPVLVLLAIWAYGRIGGRDNDIY